MKDKKNLIILLLIAVIDIIGVTIAYFSSTTTFENEFNTKEYGTTYTEEFVSLDNWLPGDTTDKTVTVTNSGQVDEAVRISLSEIWTPNNANKTLTGWIHTDGTKSNHTTENELATDVRAAVINFTNNSDWTKLGAYYYYNYKLAPGQTTDSLIESVTFNALTKLGDTCTPSTSNGTTIITCNSSEEDYDHATYKLTVNIETVQYNKYKEAWNSSISIAPTKEIVVLGLHVNPKSATYETGDKHQMYVFEHEATEQTPALTDYRYIGDDPYNYVYFNCADLNNQSSDTCEVWRIIGAFDVERTDVNNGNIVVKETRMKLIRDSLSEDTAWDTNNVNNWENSSANLLLNSNYYDGLIISAQSQIEKGIYYLGAFRRDLDFSTNHLYEFERGLTTYQNLRLTSWEGKVALMYPSDMYMTYAKGVNSVCFDTPNLCSKFTEGGNPETSWIYNTNLLQGRNGPTVTYFLSTTPANPESVYSSTAAGYLYSNDGRFGHAVRSVVYLSADVQIIDGDGSNENLYELR